MFRNFLMRIVELGMGVLAVIIPKQRNVWVFGAHNGKRYGDNAAAIFEHLLEEEALDVKPVWLTDSPKIIQELRAKGAVAERRRSLAGLWYSLVAQFVFCTHNIKDAIVYIPFFHRPTVIYLHHGIPLRKGWLDSSTASAQQRRSTQQKARATSYMIAPSTFAAEQQNKMFRFGLERFQISGLPRNDCFYPENRQEEQLRIRKQLGFSANAKIILYAPTWRPWGATKFFPFESVKLADLDQYLRTQNAYVVLRPHHVDEAHQDNQDFWKEIEQLSQFRLMPHHVVADVNALCLISDCLITDYSSLYYDYLLCNKPLIFLAYDYERYEQEIGFYPDYWNIAIGEKPNNWDEFLGCLERIMSGEDQFLLERTAFRDKFHKYQDGKSSERLVQWLKDVAS